MGGDVNVSVDGDPGMDAGANITVIGYDGAELPPAARAAVDEATLVVGGARHLSALGVPAARSMTLGPLAPAIEALAQHDGPAVVLASGDPGYFGILRALNGAGLEPAQVVPAVSSVAAAFARIGLPWDDALVVSAHGTGDGRDLRRAANVCRAHPKVALLAGPDAGAQELARELLKPRETGPARVLVVAQRLSEQLSCINRPKEIEQTSRKSPKTSSSEAERVEILTLAQAAGRVDFAQPQVVLCLDPRFVAPGTPGEGPAAPKRWVAGWPGGSGAWAAAESAFEHRDGQITKAEVRAQILARIAPGLGELVWDLGAGSGSVGIECARFGAAVVAVEQDHESCARIAANAAAHGVQVAVVEGRAPGVLAGLPRPDAVFVGGGGAEVVRAALDHRPGRVVVALASVERVAEVLGLLEADGRVVGGVLSQSSRLAALPDGTHRFAALNPVYVLWGTARESRAA
jgi:precorrin-6Y C5,15-methyltransferase (decarboxylating)